MNNTLQRSPLIFLLLICAAALATSSPAFTCSDRTVYYSRSPPHHVLELSNQVEGVRGVTNISNNTLGPCIASLSLAVREKVSSIHLAVGIFAGHTGDGSIRSIENDAFLWTASQLPKLGEVVIQGHRKLRALSQYAFHMKNVPIEMSLNLDWNGISMINSSCFEHVSNLTTLRLKNNNLTSESLINLMLPSVTTLHLGNASPDPASLHHVCQKDPKGRLINCNVFDTDPGIPVIPGITAPRLQHLYLDAAFVKFVPPALAMLPQLHTLSLKYNRLQKFPNLTIVPHLQFLYLNDNNIQQITNGLFHDQTLLRTLSLRNNPIRQIDVGSFDYLSNLRTLDVTSVPVQSLTTGIFRGLDKIERLYGFDQVAYIGAGVFDDIKDSPLLHPLWRNTTETKLLSLGMNQPGKSFCNMSEGSVSCTCGNTTSIGGSVHLVHQGLHSETCVCPATYYADRFTQQCYSCPTGKYGDMPGITSDCLDCPAGKYSEIGQTECSVFQYVFRYVFLVPLLCGLMIVPLSVLALCWFCKKMSRAEEDLVKSTELCNTQNKKINYLENWRIDEADITVGKLLATGGEGSVYRGKLRHRNRSEDLVVAIKVWTPQFQPSISNVWQEDEVEFLMAVPFERLVEFIGCGEMQHPNPMYDGERTQFCVLEYMNGGSINQRLWNKPRDTVSDKERFDWARDIAQGMKHIHDQGYAHRDLKSLNVLYSRTTGRAKVADFGLVSEMANGQIIASEASPAWLAPELCQNQVEIARPFEDAETIEGTAAKKKAYEEGRAFRDDHSMLTCDVKIDTYSFGIVMWEILTHQQPWADTRSPLEVYKRVALGERPPITEAIEAQELPGWCKLMRECWDQRPDHRPSFEQILGRLDEIALACPPVDMNAQLVHTRRCTDEIQFSTSPDVKFILPRGEIYARSQTCPKRPRGGRARTNEARHAPPLNCTEVLPNRRSNDSRSPSLGQPLLAEAGAEGEGAF